MAIKYHPNPGTVLTCDFSGMIEPEMIKERPVVVISPRLCSRTGLCTIVP
ncbi:MAG: type II toxin-antitoxin system PemK/MazF family toxin, partial [Pseudomonadota bacterium]